MRQNKGKLITIEGCEGVGKSTQINLLKAYFQESGIPSVFVREPGGTQISEQIRQIILNPQNSMDSTAELLLYAAARCQLNAEIIRPAIDSGLCVVCDRYVDSTTAYQGYGRGINLDIINQINGICLSGINIDLTIFLDLSPSEGFKRKGGADKSDRLDSESMAFHQRVYFGYKKIAEKNARVASIDASGSAGETFQKIVGAIKERGII